MTAALALRRYGISATILEAEPRERIRPGSRAIYLHKATLQMLDDLYVGLGFTLAAGGLVWPVKRTMWRGQDVYVKRYAAYAPDALPPFTSLPQVEAERFLYQACLDSGVEFVWEMPVEEVRVDQHGVTMVAANGRVWRTQYVIGADGASSVIRHQAGIKMEGTRSTNTFVVVDVQEDPKNPLPIERIFHYQHPAIGGRNVLYVPFAGGWRVDLQLFDEDDPVKYSGIAGVQNWLPKVIDPKYADRVTWVSTYQFLQVVARELTDEQHRLLFVGEAAHLFAPFGARGLNSGVPDAVAAARAIAVALHTEDKTKAWAAIQVFAQERQIAAQYNRAAAGVALVHLQGRSLGISVKRHIAVSLAGIWPSLGRWLDEGPYGPKSGPPQLATKY
ncbi:monooxygenase [Sulfoacidibacillus thermotolerans]|uniref:Monooxygenase n=2 Tax=Sulfoacidibacillus thermotolerans TaxID=1765684 RepID=A0A2U3D792_SULT2|nr:monooxygenase [Sulfoacidibacillus thermotolerans]